MPGILLVPLRVLYGTRLKAIFLAYGIQLFPQQAQFLIALNQLFQLFGI